MKAAFFVGAWLIVLSVAVLVVKAFSVESSQTVLLRGNIEASTVVEKQAGFSPLYGWLGLATGVGLLWISQKK